MTFLSCLSAYLVGWFVANVQARREPPSRQREAATADGRTDRGRVGETHEGGTVMNDGGPAFPFSMHPEHCYGPTASVNVGLSLRDYFAAHVDVRPMFEVANKIRHFEELTGEPYPGDGASVLSRAKWYAKAHAILRYIQSDAMLKERDHATTLDTGTAGASTAPGSATPQA